MIRLKNVSRSYGRGEFLFLAGTQRRGFARSGRRRPFLLPSESVRTASGRHMTNFARRPGAWEALLKQWSSGGAKARLQSFSERKGLLPWPVAGRIISRSDPIQKSSPSRREHGRHVGDQTGRTRPGGRRRDGDACRPAAGVRKSSGAESWEKLLLALCSPDHSNGSGG